MPDSSTQPNLDALLKRLDKIAGDGAPTTQPTGDDLQGDVLSRLDAIAGGGSAPLNPFQQALSDFRSSPEFKGGDAFDMEAYRGATQSLDTAIGAKIEVDIAERALGAALSGSPVQVGTREERADMQRHALLPGAIANLPPEQQRSVIENTTKQDTFEDAKGGPISTPDAAMMEFAAQAAPLFIDAPANVGRFVFGDGVMDRFGDLGSGNTGAQMSALLDQFPPQSQADAAIRGVGGALGFGSTLLSPAGRIGVGLGTKLGAGATGRLLGAPASSGIARFAPGLAGFTAADQVPAALAGHVSPAEAAVTTLGAPLGFANLPIDVVEATAEAVTDPESSKTREALLTAAPAALLALGRKGREKTAEVEPKQSPDRIRMGPRRPVEQKIELTPFGSAPGEVVREGIVKKAAPENPKAEFSNKAALSPPNSSTAQAKAQPATASGAGGGTVNAQNRTPATFRERNVERLGRALNQARAELNDVKGKSFNSPALRQRAIKRAAAKVQKITADLENNKALVGQPGSSAIAQGMSQSQIEFVTNRVRTLGSVDAVRRAYPSQSKVARFAVALAREKFVPKEPESIEVKGPSKGGPLAVREAPATGPGRAASEIPLAKKTPPPPEPPDTKSPGAGSVSPLRDRPKRQTVGGALSTPGVSYFAQSLLDRVGKQGGPVGRVVRERGLEAVKRAGEIEGKVAPKLFTYEQTVRRVPLGGKIIREQRKLPKDVQKEVQLGRQSLESDLSTVPVEGFGEMGFARIQQAVEGGVFGANLLIGGPARSKSIGGERLLEGTINPKNDFARRPLSKGERLITAMYGDITKTLFQESRRRGVKAVKNGKAVDFMHDAKGNKFLRVPTPEFYKIAPNSEAWRGLRKGLAKINNMPVNEVQEALKEMRDPSSIRTVGSIEMLRVFKHFPTHFKTTNGKTVQLLETDPIRALRGGIRHIADRTAFIEMFGQETKGRPINDKGRSIDRLRQKFLDKGGFEGDFNDLVSALNDRPAGKQLTSHSPRGDSILSIPRRVALGFVNPVIESGMLSMAAVPNLFETSRLASFAGTRRSVRAARNLATEPRMTRHDLREMGAITTSLLDFHLQKGRRIEDLGRIIGTIGRRITGFDPINELNESFAAETGRVMAQDLYRGFVQKGDAARLRTLEFTPKQVKQLLDQTAPRELYDDIARRVAKTQGSTLRLAEQSRAQNSTLFKRVFPFQSYMQLSARLMNRMVNDFHDGFRNRDVRQVAGATNQLARFLAANGIAGGAALWTLALFGGKDRDRGDESWPEYVGRNLSATLVGGPLASMWYATQNDKGIAETVWGTSAPARVLENIWDANQGKGRYRDKEGGEAVVEFLRSAVPISRMQRGYMVLMGLHDEKMDSAVSAYWGWRDKNKPAPKVDSRGHSKFRANMRTAYRHIRNGDLDSADASVAAALATGEKKEPLASIRDSINSRRVLYELTDAELTSLKNKIGNDKFEKLKTHDALLAEFQWKNTKAARLDWWRGRLSKMDTNTMTRPQLRQRAIVEKFFRNMNTIKRTMDAPDTTREKRRQLRTRLDELIEKAHDRVMEFESGS